MSIEQLIAQAEKLNVSPMILELIAQAHEIGKTDGVQDAAITLGMFDETEAIEILAENYAGVTA